MNEALVRWKKCLYRLKDMFYEVTLANFCNYMSKGVVAR